MVGTGALHARQELKCAVDLVEALQSVLCCVVGPSTHWSHGVGR